MADLYIDVHLELNPDELRLVKDPARYVLELSRDVAEQKCVEGGAILRTDRAPEVVIGKGLVALTGQDVVTCSSRWAATAPLSVLSR